VQISAAAAGKLDRESQRKILSDPIGHCSRIYSQIVSRDLALDLREVRLSAVLLRFFIRSCERNLQGRVLQIFRVVFHGHAIARGKNLLASSNRDQFRFRINLDCREALHLRHAQPSHPQAEQNSAFASRARCYPAAS